MKRGYIALMAISLLGFSSVVYGEDSLLKVQDEYVILENGELFNDDIQIKSIDIKDLDITPAIGDKFVLEYTTSPQVQGAPVKWVSLNGNAYVNSNGTVEVLDKGNIQIKAIITNKDGSKVEDIIELNSVYGESSFIDKGDIKVINSRSKIRIKMNSKIDDNTKDNIFIAKGITGNTPIEVNIRVLGDIVVIENPSTWEDGTYLFINKDLADFNGVKLNKRLRYKISVR